MINLAFPSDGLFFRSNNRHLAPSPSQDRREDSDPSKAVSNSIGMPPATGGPWTLCSDQQLRPFWLNHATGQWMYPGATNIVQPPPPPMMYIPQAPQQHVTWVVSPQGAFPQAVQAPWAGAVFVPVAVPVSPTSSSPQKSGVSREGAKKESKTLLLKPSWERCYDGRGKSVWIHSTTGKLVHEDPYE